jgi:two-component system, OmpR family, sensor histidine kinase CiaH
MFQNARIKLTAWYLAIIMAISLSFSAVIFVGINRELIRFEAEQNLRQQRTDRINAYLRINGIELPDAPSIVDSDTIEAARFRIISILGFINLSIVIFSGLGGYFLAGQTLEPIARMVEDQKEFVSDASHELRTPITSLKTEIEVAMRDKKMTISDAKNILKSNLEDVDRMQRLANYLLSMNRYERGKHLTMLRVDLASVAKTAVGKKKIKIDLESTIVNGNFDSLVELVTILLDNAQKYGKGKEILVKTVNHKISVKDNGVGIVKEDLPHIFDRFYRSDKSRGTEGYGLGLSIAKSIVDLHGAKISVNSTLGKGTTFTVYF